MERDGIHALTAAYALDALDEPEEREYEAHLRVCEHCRAELADLTETATSLAYALDAPAPPPELRGRILERAAQEQATVIPFRPRRVVTYASAAVAAVAASVAIGVGIWAASVADELEREREVAQLLSEPGTRVLDVTGATGRLIVAESGEATLVVSGLRRAPEGRTYELWVIEGRTPRPAGLFRSEGERDVVELQRPVPSGATVAATIERAGGVDAPTGDPVFTARA